ncbi:5-epiaristolochene 1,3-dihydroxylase-like [Panicum miliaceum]|uniref:5-epiaristolochene 1,3-dihydroxylase-like n=1 Tax=Panicum miliaceum TaxID=4540 RepID=A0A3L6R571_PANMI|nr:5-epiaristolochene 1,3-dihydroxylase-like [Panicum miliaceum]
MDGLSLHCCSCLLLLALLYSLTKCYYYSASARSGCHRGGLRLPPCPWQLPVLGSLHHLVGELPHRSLRRLSRRYGPLMLLRFGEVPVVVVSSGEAAREVMRTHDAVFATRPQTATIRTLTNQAQAIALTPYGDHWRRLRKICAIELLSAGRVRSFRPVREEEVARLVGAVSSASGNSKLMNLSEMIAAYVADTAVHAIMGRRLDDRDAFLRYIDEAIRLASGVSLADLFPSSWIAGALSWRTHKAEVYREGLLKFLDAVITEHVERKSEEAKSQEDLIDVLLRIQGQGSSSQFLTMGTIKAVIFDLFSAGTETAATTLQWAMAELMRNPDMMSRAQAEVRAVFMPRMKVVEEGLSELKYLHWIIKETLRLHIPGPLLIPRECRETCKVLGYDVPKGAMVLVNAWAISRDPQCWEEPEKFKPDRFESDTRDFKGNDFEFTPFGAGRRICPGMLFGLANVELALANLLFHFDWSLPDGIRPGELDMTEAMGITARREKDLWLRAKVVSSNLPH